MSKAKASSNPGRLYGLPSNVPLFGTTFDVGVLSPEDEVKYGQGGRLLGLFDPEDQMISIKAGMPPLLRLAVFFHELAHLRVLTTGIGNLLTDEQEEGLADWVGFWISELFGSGLLQWGPAARKDGAE